MRQVIAFCLSFVLLSNVAAYAQTDAGDCTDVTLSGVASSDGHTAAEFGLPGLEKMAIADQLTSIESLYGTAGVIEALQWCNQGHTWALTAWWGLRGHEIEWTVNGHDRALSKSWRRLDHYWHTSQQWVREGHEVALTKDWERMGHAIPITQDWTRTGHRTQWSRDGHSTSVSNNWQDAGHAYALTRSRQHPATGSRAEVWQQPDNSNETK